MIVSSDFSIEKKHGQDSVGYHRNAERYDDNELNRSLRATRYWKRVSFYKWP